MTFSTSVVADGILPHSLVSACPAFAAGVRVLSDQLSTAYQIPGQEFSFSARRRNSFMQRNEFERN